MKNFVLFKGPKTGKKMLNIYAFSEKKTENNKLPKTYCMVGLKLLGEDKKGQFINFGINIETYSELGGFIRFCLAREKFNSIHKIGETEKVMDCYLFEKDGKTSYILQINDRKKKLKISVGLSLGEMNILAIYLNGMLNEYWSGLKDGKTSGKSEEKKTQEKQAIKGKETEKDTAPDRHEDLPF